MPLGEMIFLGMCVGAFAMLGLGLAYGSWASPH